MPGYFKIKGIDRIIDANITRAKEGLRVCEEITRFILDSRSLTAALKNIRHTIDSLSRSLAQNKNLLKARESRKDIGKNIYINELKRRGVKDIFFANCQRVKESIRVMEEFSKLKNKATALKFKNLRYALYEIEKKTAGKIASLRYYR